MKKTRPKVLSDASIAKATFALCMCHVDSIVFTDSLSSHKYPYTPEFMTHDDTLRMFSVGHVLQIDQFKPTELASTA